MADCWQEHRCDICGTSWENERFRSLLTACRDWFDNPDGEPTSSDLLDRINEALR